VEFYYYAEPVELPGHPNAVLRLAVPLTQVAASIAAVRTLILRASAVAALLALLVAYLTARTFTRRIRRIENYAKELVNADYSGALAAEGDDELGSVARSLRIMAEHFRGMLARIAQESSRREAILGSMVEGILAVERNLRITFYNDAFARAVHASMPAPNGVSLSHVVRDPAVGELLSRVIATGTPARERMCLISAEGRIFQVQAAPLDEPDGRGAIATFHDITELERLERTRKDCVANISHELRTPLAAIQGYAETLLEGALEDTENSRRFLEIIVAHTTRINNLASDLLTLSEIEAERILVPSEKISAVELVEDALQRVAARASEREIRASLSAADEVYVVGQRGRLERAISNLLLNAIDFNRPGGEVRIDVRRVDATARISIADDGIGIAPQDLRRIFERFYRVDRARSHQTGGAGLGLSIVKNTVERAGGSIIVDSQLGRGSVFTLVFPAV
jgi:two-component system phosphate regulon sensor histidine kinase PhoR